MKKPSLVSLSKISLAVIFVICAVVITSTVLYLIADRDYQKLRKLEPAKETANWNVYENEEYKFEIKYPDDISDPDISDVGFKAKYLQQTIDFDIDDRSKISIFIWDREIPKSSDKENKGYEKVVVNKKIILQNKSNPLKNYIYHKAHIFQIEYFGDREEKNTKLYNNMLSTLKLVD